MVDLYSKTILTVIAVGVVALVIQNAMEEGGAQTAYACGDNQYSPCFVRFPSDDPIRVEAANPDGLRVRAFADDFSVDVASWSELSALDVRVKNWP